MTTPIDRRSALTLALMVLLTASFWATAASAIGLVIDNYEEGPFAMTGGLSSQSGMNPLSCLATERVIYMTGGYEARLDQGNVDDGVQFITHASDYLLSLQYQFGVPGYDITQGGIYDRIVLRVAAAPTIPTTVKIRLIDSNFNEWGAIMPVRATPGHMEILLSWFLGVDRTKISSFLVEVTPDLVPNIDDGFRLTDIRMASATARVLFVDIPTQFIPQPFPTVHFGFAIVAEDGTEEDRGRISMTVQDVTHEGTPVEAMLMVEDSMPANGAGWAGGFALSDAIAPKRADHREANIIFEVFGNAGEVVRLIGSPTVTPNGGKSVVVHFDVETSDPTGLPAFISSYHLRVEIPQERALMIQEALVDQLSDTSFQLGVAAVPSAAGKAQTGDETFFRGELTGSEEPIGYSTSTPALASGTALSLTARPSVWSGKTQLWLEGSRNGGEISVYNRAGRKIRRLSVPGGSNFVNWDGRDAQGEPVGSGVYFLRFRGTEGAAATKVVRLR